MSERFVVQNNRQLRQLVNRYCRSSNHGLPPIGEWDVSQVTDMSDLFLGNRTFNDNINNWNVSNVVDFSRMFKGAEVFNQPLDKWGPKLNPDANFDEMFYGAKLFTKNLRSWDNVLANSTKTDMMFKLSGIESRRDTLGPEYYGIKDDLSGGYRKSRKGGRRRTRKNKRKSQKRKTRGRGRGRM